MTPSQVSALPVSEIRPIPRPVMTLPMIPAVQDEIARMNKKPAYSPAEIDAMLAELKRINAQKVE